MPVGRITTTLSAGSIPDGFGDRFAELIVKLLPERTLEQMFTIIHPDTKIFNTRVSPDGAGEMVFVEMVSMYAFTLDNVETTRKAIIDFIHGELKIAKDKILVVSTDVPDKFAGLGKNE